MKPYYSTLKEKQMAIEELLDDISEENKRIARTTLRDPLPYELDLPEFNAVWNVIKNWDIGRPTGITKNGGQLYAHGTGTDVVTILDALRGVGVIKPLKQPDGHIESERCWCEPELEYEDPQTGNQVWVHRDIT